MIMENSTTQREIHKFQLPVYIKSNLGMWIIGSILLLNLVLTGYLLWNGKGGRHHPQHKEYTLQGRVYDSYTSCINGDCTSSKETRWLTERELRAWHKDMQRRHEVFDRYWYKHNRLMEELWFAIW